MQMDFKERLNLVHHTRLLFEDSEGMASFLEMKSAVTHNSVAGCKRNDFLVKEDYIKLVNRAAALTNSVLGWAGDNSYGLSNLLEDYAEATESGDFFTPENSRPDKGRGIFYMKGEHESGAVRDILIDFVNGRHGKDVRLCRALRLTVGDVTTIVGNYYCTIGVLLLIGSIPFCSVKSRPGRSRRNLESDTRTALDFLSDLRYCAGTQNKLFDYGLRCIEREMREPSWCRLKLIVAVKRQLEYFAQGISPAVMEELNLPPERQILKTIPCAYGYYASRDLTGRRIYRLEASKEGSRTRYLFRYDERHRIWERFRLDLYRHGRVAVSMIDSEYERYVSGSSDDHSTIGRYRLGEDRVTIWEGGFGFSFVDIVRVPDDAVSPTVRSCTAVKDQEKSFENRETVAVMMAIFRSSLVLEDRGGDLYVVRDTESNNLRNILPSLRIDDNVSVIRFCGRLILLFDTYPGLVFKIFDITTPELMERYGVTFEKRRSAGNDR